MKTSIRSRLVHSVALSLLSVAALPSLGSAQEKEVKVTVVAGAVPPPPVSITLHERHGHVTSIKGRCTHTGGGLIDIASPAPDTVIITMSGAVVANSVMQFDLEQLFEVSFDDPKVKRAKLTLEGRVVGLLRGERMGCAEYADACVHLLAGTTELTSVCVPPHNACGCQSLAVNDHDGPNAVGIGAGKLTLHQTFNISARSNCGLFKRPSAEFAPDPALDPLWINFFEPFHGVKKDSFGFQVIVRVAPDTDEPAGGKKAVQSAPVPPSTKGPAVAKSMP
jgi:hypothetical protein